MYKRLTRYLLVILTAAPFLLSAQDSLRRHKLDASFDIYTHHLWRGAANGTSVSLQPSVEYSYGNFSAGVWGAWSIDGSYTELDLYAAYSLGSFNVTLYDYFCPVNPVKEFEFFEIRQGTTRHTFDLNVAYARPEKHPFGLLVATMIYGDDINPETGDNYYSTYIEPSFHFRLLKSDMKLVSGFTPVKSYYADRFAFVNTGLSASRIVKLARKVNIPAILKLAYNPYADKFHFSFGITL
ncbi:hypothetical protein [Lentimicrobium sp.]|uniref:hypothetical protein n=1 Tax=Lentimicrobium sp. TaxID=2034841 RepID=UPI002B8F56F7|nr:hypothetical protein [Lentimicrobium sp.]MCO5262081.1 hypothetical protein [Lentimicrobium sp.]HOP13494.1 hypothetical protein [Lentimicrobium sp.]HPJ62293.1 hypothetical protein [Lentimicrobium sp.]HPR25497.1 hypothetical protein [Lentimicrobium sp.]HRW68221.1 hypothetical protein [Lentimicrobium sp.]